MGYIYVITNKINGKQYVGKTEYENPEKRFSEHIRNCKTRKCEKRPLYDAMNKYGAENFLFEILEETDDTLNREKYWIQKLNTYGNTGQNATLGGGGKAYVQFSDEEVIKYHCSEGNYVAGRTAKKFGVDKKTIKNILQRNNIVWLSKSEFSKFRDVQDSRYICQVDKNLDIIINIFHNQPDACEYLGYDRKSTAIRSVLHGRNLTAYGFRWVFLTEIPQNYKYNKDLAVNCSEYVKQHLSKLQPV